MTTKATHLIIVCCHSIYTGGVSGNLYNESNWLLKSFQKSTSTKEGEHETLIRHIFAAIRIHSEHPDNSIIIFSGAATSYSHPELSEAQSYLDAWEALKAVGEVAKGVVDAKGNVILEENATDFYQNLLFSVVKFRNMNGQYPSHITIIAPAFKKARCLELHAKAIKWPTSQLTFHGIDPPFASVLFCHEIFPFGVQLEGCYDANSHCDKRGARTNHQE
ncbi:hypothetical protein EJ08DRAFT_644705 [Tothia fuscella]|uniref:DUF218 domain-containing protein n=1 Tax=Tothia fuscella TaxID=1048955 RepID=A0A9P4P331_9PEZI|nr:hypothetical protein EJ08DRAFT_644705 [Tothia fuscella]